MRHLPPTLYFGNKASRLLEEPAGYLRVFWRPGEQEPLVFQVVFNYCPFTDEAPAWLLAQK